MDTILPLGLATMMATRQSFELIDVRPRDQFEWSHIDSARSIPLESLSPAKSCGSTAMNPLTSF